VRRYFFHTDDGQSFRDEEGTLLAGDDAARIEAARVLGQMMSESPGDVWRDDQFRITVTDEYGVILFVIDLAALTSPAAGPRQRPPGEGPGG
jgi:hypothetical protein